MRKAHIFHTIVMIFIFSSSCDKSDKIPEEIGLKEQIVNKSWESQYTFIMDEKDGCVGKIERLIFNEDDSHEIILATGDIKGTYQIIENKYNRYIYFDSKYVDAQTKEEISFQSKWLVTGVYPTTMHVVVKSYTNFTKFNCHGFVFMVSNN